MIVKILLPNAATKFIQADEVHHQPTTIFAQIPDTIHYLDVATHFDGDEIEGNIITVSNGQKEQLYFTNCPMYLMNDNGKTIERL